jgi:hypothetical protein
MDNTMVEALQRIYKSITEAKLVQDADMPFLVQMETMLLDRIKQPVDQMQQQGMFGGAPAPGAMPPGMAPGMNPAPAAPSFGGMGGGMGGVAQGAAPNFDELRRMLQ